MHRHFKICGFWKQVKISGFSDAFRQLFEKNTISLNSCHGNQTKNFLLTLDFLKLSKVSLITTKFEFCTTKGRFEFCTTKGR